MEEISLRVDTLPIINQAVPWKHLKTMDILASTDDILKVIVKMVQNKLLPSLEVLLVVVSNTVPYTGNSMRVMEAKYAIAKYGIVKG